MRLVLLFLLSFLLAEPIWAGASQSLPLVVAHRGASREAPENTIPAFELAWKHGADAIEADFYLTKDGKIVCIHDKDTKRVANKKLVVSNATLAELKELDVGANKGTQFVGTRIPTIGEVFKTIPEGKKIYVEIKCGVEIIPVLIKEIKDSGLKDSQVIIISFDQAVLKAFKSQAPQHKAYWLSSTKNGKGGISPSVTSVIATLKQIGADGLSSNQKYVDGAYIKEILQQGFEYHVWTINDVKAADRFKQWGAGSITTDMPEQIKTQLIQSK